MNKGTEGYVRRTMACLFVATVLMLVGPGQALAKKPNRKARPAKVSKSKAKEPSIGHSLQWLRNHLAAAGKAGKPSDLATQMLATLMEVSFAQAVHSHYGLASLGQALRSGGMNKDTVSISARDMVRNHRQLNVRFSELSRQKPFRGQLGKIFSDLAALSVTATATAKALVAWSGQAENKALAIAFESALERYRNEVRAFATRVKGP
jgi:hypothetical protein